VLVDPRVAGSVAGEPVTLRCCATECQAAVGRTTNGAVGGDAAGAQVAGRYADRQQTIVG